MLALFFGAQRRNNCNRYDNCLNLLLNYLLHETRN